MEYSNLSILHMCRQRLNWSVACKELDEKFEYLSIEQTKEGALELVKWKTVEAIEAEYGKWISHPQDEVDFAPAIWAEWANAQYEKMKGSSCSSHKFESC